MITLITGLPGHGKSLFAITKIKELAEKSGRFVFYSGMTDVKLPWSEIDADKWFECPEGSIIVIDEAQRNFPVRSAKDAVPEKCRQFETHRHKGFDVYLITQDSMLIDHHVRRLVGQYFRIVRPFGQSFANVYEFQRVVEWDDYHEQKNALKSIFKYPTENFNLYRSAEIHTVKKRFPKKLLLLPLLLCFIGGGIYGLYYTLWGKKQPETVALASEVKNKPAGMASTSSSTNRDSKKPKTLQEYVAERSPRVYDVPESAPVYDEIAKPVVFPYIAACVIKDDECTCYNQQGIKVSKISESYCTNFVENGAFDPYRKEEGRGPSPQAQRGRPSLEENKSSGTKNIPA